MFAELLARSSFSFLRGASQPEEMMSRAKELGLESVALCDKNGLYGSVRAFARAKEIGVRLIVGAEVDLATPGSVVERSSAWRPSAADPTAPDAPSVALLAESHAGYTNLCRLLTRAHAGL